MNPFTIKDIILPTLIFSIYIILAGFFIKQTLCCRQKPRSNCDWIGGLVEKNQDSVTHSLQLTVSGNELGQLQTTLEKQTKILQEFFSDLGLTEVELTVGSLTIQDNLASL